MDQSSVILDSWHANAGNWIATIDNNEIESRSLVTNNAILQVISEYGPASILDIGCGEGWLTRALRAQGIDAAGVDAVDTLVTNAIEKGGAHYAVAGFREIANGSFELSEKMAAAVINFALLDEEDAANLMKNMDRILQNGGLLFVQTLHPFSMTGQEPYISGWKNGSWKGLKRDFAQPYQWYFRTMGDWVKLFIASGLTIREVREPLHPVNHHPASVIFVLSLKGH
ncbi:class I SAM-dependent methyltransferase [Pseudobacter ginsenosidimutans]|uniref:Methyltransferase family protein n=1 Tax=Pseudobacter ginsenosidimutans TaxID=661488 RepID=A0A4Q7N1K9_9BACT|nr:class I SAM-dependent methyltransferase [Pseudobacter ginsenosidimutans]QEC44061.1 class I SAM-dependent methyltransferase [Pseudobacter ginsenosidimutans]RZS75500.1 methyltransferase family protein [Pseudobacter ginsenosidimutans]